MNKAASGERILGTIEAPEGRLRPDLRAAIVCLLRAVLASGAVDALLVPLRHPAGDAVTPALVKDPRLLDEADPLAPVLPVNGARLMSMLTRRAPLSAAGAPRIGAVLRNCELRALVELVKLGQASLEGATLIGVDCMGTYELQDYASIARGAAPADFPLRLACQMCEHPALDLADIAIRRIGVEDPAGLYVETSPQWAERLGLAPAGEVCALAAARARLTAERSAVRDRALREFEERTSSPEALAAYFSACIRCHNCMTNCPICYCKTCFFKTEVFDHDPAQFVAWAARKGAVRLPTDTLLFHLTRMNHMSTSCVGCGLCTSACPAGIQVGLAFRAAAARTQALFDYLPGRSLDEAPPVKTFAVDELGGLGA